MLHHIEIYVSDLRASRAFWSYILADLDYVVSDDWEDGFTLAKEDGAYLTFVQVSEKHENKAYHRCAVGLNHLALKVFGKEAVDQLRQKCREANIPCLYDDKYPFANGGSDYYALYVEDPDRIKVEFVAV
ncbi:MAG: VOC family protein [Granulosicoccus sp.]